MQVGIADEVLQLEVVAEIVFELEGGDVVVDPFLVQVAPAKIIVAADAVQLAPVQRRHAIVGKVVVALVEVAQGQAGRGVQAEGQGWRDAPALLVDLFAPGDVVVVGHEVEAEGGRFAKPFQRLVGVQGQAPVAVRAQSGAQVGEGFGLGLLADHVDAAAAGAGAAEHRVRSLDHFHRLQVEQVAAAGLGAVAQPVHLHVGVGAEAADVDAVAGTAAALAGVEGDAGDVGQHLAQAQGVLLLDHLLRHHRDGLRGIQQRHGVLGRGRAFDPGRRLLAGDRVGSQFQGIVLARRVLGQDRRGAGGHQQHQRRQRAFGGQGGRLVATIHEVLHLGY